LFSSAQAQKILSESCVFLSFLLFLFFFLFFITKSKVGSARCILSKMIFNLALYFF